MLEAKNMPAECEITRQVTGNEPEITDIKEPDLDIVRLLESDGGIMAFQGLRRRMNIHQEKLSRALQRLEEDGYVQRTPKGYTLTPRGSCLAQQWLRSPPRTYTTILQSFLPADLSPVTMAQHLEGRWFHNLRWLGCREDGDETVLRWVTEEGGVEIILKLRWGQIIVETDASDQERLIEALIAAQKVFGYLTEPWREDWERMHMGAKLVGWSDRCQYSAG